MSQGMASYFKNNNNSENQKSSGVEWARGRAVWDQVRQAGRHKVPQAPVGLGMRWLISSAVGSHRRVPRRRTWTELQFFRKISPSALRKIKWKWARREAGRPKATPGVPAKALAAWTGRQKEADTQNTLATPSFQSPAGGWGMGGEEGDEWGDTPGLLAWDTCGGDICWDRETKSRTDWERGGVFSFAHVKIQRFLSESSVRGCMCEFGVCYRNQGRRYKLGRQLLLL